MPLYSAVILTCQIDFLYNTKIVCPLVNKCLTVIFVYYLLTVNLQLPIEIVRHAGIWLYREKTGYESHAGDEFHLVLECQAVNHITKTYLLDHLLNVH